MTRRIHACGSILGVFIAACQAAGGQLRIVTYNVASLNSENAENRNCVPGSLTLVFEALNADDQPGFALAPHVYVFQEVPSNDVALLEQLLNAAAPEGITYTLGTYTSSPRENSCAGAQAMFYRSDALEEIGSEHADLDICICREADRWKLRLIGNTTPGASFYIYSAHLSSATQAERLCGVTNIRADADLLPEGTQVIYAGDMNFGHNQEPGYLHFLSDGPGQAIDALGTRPWNCSADPFTAIKHTQSPRDNGAPLCGLIPGGMDDRFDFLLMTAELLDGKGIDYLPGTYRALGNDGMHCESAINDGDNFYYPADVARSNALADALHDASDHLPVVADYQIVCPWDLDDNGSVDILDLLALLVAWGTDPGGPPDFDGDGNVGILDLMTLLANWGACA